MFVKGSLLLPVSKARTINLIFSDNVRIFCLIFNAKTPKTSAKLSEKSNKNKRRSNHLYGLLCDARAYTVTISCSRSIPEKKTYILVNDRM